MDERKAPRKSFEETLEVLFALGLADRDAPPKRPPRRPSYDDSEPWGVSFFRTLLKDAALENLTLPRTFFVGADLRGSDLRASVYERVDFSGAALDRCDLRRSGFEQCRFDGATMKGAILVRSAALGPSLGEDQRRVVDWRRSAGEAPPGG